MRGRVISTTLNLRAGPSANAQVRRVLQHGQLVEFADGSPTTGRWIAVSAAGEEGYVARRLVAQSPDQPLVAIPPELEALIGATL
jgi:hypothetical protein